MQNHAEDQKVNLKGFGWFSHLGVHMFERSAANQQLPHVDNKRPAPPQDDTGENPEVPEGGSPVYQRF